MLKKYKVEIEEINKYKFMISAINKEEAEKSVIDIIENTEVLDMNLLAKKTEYSYCINSLFQNEKDDVNIYII